MVFGTLAALLFLAYGAPDPQPLSIENIALSQSEDGPPVPASSYFMSGETVFLSFQVSGYRPLGEEEQSIKLNWRLQATDPAGVLITKPQSGEIATSLSREDKHWMPKVRQIIQLPPFGPSGAYHLGVWLKDEVANTDARKDIEFQVRGRDVAPSPVLAIRDLHFYRGEDDRKPLEVAAYRPGDTVWIRFEMVGFKLGEQNRFEVGYGIQVNRPGGETLFQQPEAAVERDQSFYPRAVRPCRI